MTVKRDAFVVQQISKKKDELEELEDDLLNTKQMLQNRFDCFVEAGQTTEVIELDVLYEELMRFDTARQENWKQFMKNLCPDLSMLYNTFQCVLHCNIHVYKQTSELFNCDFYMLDSPLNSLTKFSATT